MCILNQTQQKYSLVVVTKCCISDKCSSLLNSVSYYRKTQVNINFCLYGIFVAFYNIWSFKYYKISNIILLALHYYLQPMLGLASSIWNKRTECIHFEMQLIFNNCRGVSVFISTHGLTDVSHTSLENILWIWNSYDMTGKLTGLKRKYSFWLSLPLNYIYNYVLGRKLIFQMPVKFRGLWES